MVVKTVDISEARTRFDDLVSSVAAGAEIVIAKDEKPVVRMVPVSVPSRERKPGLGRGEIWISDDFDDLLPDEFWTGGQ